MARKKQQTTKSSDGKHRKETKEEKRIRLQKQEEARERCFKMLPIVGVGILALVIAFGLWVRTVPPKVATNPIKVQQRVVNPGNKGTPDFMKVDTGPKNVVDEAAQEKLKDADQGETIEL